MLRRKKLYNGNHVLGRCLPRGEEGFVLPMIMGVLLVVGVMASLLLVAITMNQQGVMRDKDYTQSLSVAEAGLNQYLWMISDGKSGVFNNYAIAGNELATNPHKKTYTLTEKNTGVIKGTYTMEITPPSASDMRVGITITGTADSPQDVPRTVTAHIGRPAFSEYALLTNDQVYIGGPIERVYHGKIHSNVGVRIDTGNINETVTASQENYKYVGDNAIHPGVWTGEPLINAAHPSRSLWKFPVPIIDFNIVKTEFLRLHDLAKEDDDKGFSKCLLPYVAPSPAGAAHGWFIKLLPGEKYQIAKVTAESEANNSTYGSLTFGALEGPFDYPDNGVLYANDNVWIEGTGVTGRITIASSGQLNPVGQDQKTSIHVTDDLIYATKDGMVAVGLIAQENLEIPTYAPRSKAMNTGTNMEIDAAIIAQTGRQYVNRFTTPYWPRKGTLKYYGSTSSYGTPERCTSNSDDINSANWCGFFKGDNTYDSYLLYNPPPHFPTVGSFQILDWRELPSSQGLAVEP